MTIRGASIHAQLVRSEKREGKPRQKILAYLGCCREICASPDCEWGLEHRHAFWVTAEAALDRLALDAATRSKIETALAARVARPTPEAVAAERQRFEAEFWEAWREKTAEAGGGEKSLEFTGV
jgi:hypothetical protein